MKTIKINQVKKILEKNKNINYAFLFGSALTKTHEESDVDILVGTEKGLSFSERSDLAFQIGLLFSKTVDIVDTSQAPSEVILKALAKGKPLTIRDRTALKKDYYTHFYRYEDALSLRKIRAKKIKRMYSNGR